MKTKKNICFNLKSNVLGSLIALTLGPASFASADTSITNQNINNNIAGDGTTVDSGVTNFTGNDGNTWSITNSTSSALDFTLTGGTMLNVTDYNATGDTGIVGNIDGGSAMSLDGYTGDTITLNSTATTGSANVNIANSSVSTLGDALILRGPNINVAVSDSILDGNTNNYQDQPTIILDATAINSMLTLDNVTLTGWSSGISSLAQEAAISIQNGSKLTTTQNAIELEGDNSTLDINGSTLASASENGIYVSASNAVVTVTGSTITGGSVSGQSAIDLEDGASASLTVADSTLSGATAIALHIDNSTMNISNSSLQSDADHGGIYNDSANSTINITDNTSVNGGSGILDDGSTGATGAHITVDDSSLTGTNGSGIVSSGTDSVIVLQNGASVTGSTDGMELTGGNATVMVTAGAMVTGSDAGYGINASGDNASLQASSGSTVSGGTGILLGNTTFPLVVDSATVTGTQADGITATGDATAISVQNGASVSGAVNGIALSGATDILTVLGSGTTVSGATGILSSGADATLTVDSGAAVSGTTDGIQATGTGATLVVSNGATVTGSDAGYGINASGGNASLQASSGSTVSGGTGILLGNTTF
ncbi:beta strand repeat-containing protein, partial [Lelliottia wanjuensis]|uniref:beta strand repeat-containing protein n=1 Tax=Lelliottia wanjuensis TaxID=3050585 RepID=UPI00254EFA72